MTHIAIQESLDGKNVEWMEHVTTHSMSTVLRPGKED
jgi:hypothetical protein